MEIRTIFSFYTPSWLCDVQNVPNHFSFEYSRARADRQSVGKYFIFIICWGLSLMFHILFSFSSFILPSFLFFSCYLSTLSPHNLRFTSVHFPLPFSFRPLFTSRFFYGRDEGVKKAPVNHLINHLRGVDGEIKPFKPFILFWLFLFVIECLWRCNLLKCWRV